MFSLSVFESSGPSLHDHSLRVLTKFIFSNSPESWLTFYNLEYKLHTGRDYVFSWWASWRATFFMDYLHRLRWPCWWWFLRPPQLCSSKYKFILLMKVSFEFCCYRQTTGRALDMKQVLPCYTDTNYLSFATQLRQRAPLRKSGHAFGNFLSRKGQA